MKYTFANPLTSAVIKASSFKIFKKELERLVTGFTTVLQRCNSDAYTLHRKIDRARLRSFDFDLSELTLRGDMLDMGRFIINMIREGLFTQDLHKLYRAVFVEQQTDSIEYT